VARIASLPNAPQPASVAITSDTSDTSDGRGFGPVTALSPTGLRAQLDRYVASTPPDRDRFVDFLRVLAIGVVIVWHWVLSITHWGNEALAMPNPIDMVPGARIATWVLQIMPLFFVVGGFVNLAGWDSVRRDGGGWQEFYGVRLRRLLWPTAVFIGVWLLLDGVLLVARPDHRSVLEWGQVVFKPLWFIGVYLWVILLVPLTARLHAAGGVATVTTLGALIAVVDVGRFQLGIEELGFVNSALVWVFVHQLGYLYRDGTLDRIGTRGQAALALTALAGMVVLTNLPVYAVSMVATRDVGFSHMWPTTAMIGVVALLQTGLAMLLRPLLQSWLQRRSVWKTVIATNAVILTIFVWHMTAKVAFIGLYETLGFGLIAEPTLTWWAQRPVWLIGPSIVLAGLVALFAPFELRLRGEG
jgi:hypothetical protein